MFQNEMRNLFSGPYKKWLSASLRRVLKIKSYQRFNGKNGKTDG
jgi:hypothetical protein